MRHNKFMAMLALSVAGALSLAAAGQVDVQPIGPVGRGRGPFPAVEATGPVQPAVASVPDLSLALNEALHAPSACVHPAGRGGVGAGIYTLEVKDKPFWEVFFALSQQQPLTISSTTTGMRLLNGGIRVQRYAVDG